MTITHFTPASVPSISSSAMLVELSISLWTARKLDKRASDDVTTTNNADKGVARVTKSLLGNCDELDALVKFGSNVRNMHYNSTLPWSDMGPRLLPTVKFFAYQKMMTQIEAEFNRMVQAFLDAYDLEVAQAQAKLGDLFDVNEYPSVGDLRSKFSFRINYIPCPMRVTGAWTLATRPSLRSRAISGALHISTRRGHARHLGTPAWCAGYPVTSACRPDRGWKDTQDLPIRL